MSDVITAAPIKTESNAGGDIHAELKALRDENQRLKQERDTPQPSLADKVQKENEEKLKKSSDSKSLETALMFNMTSQDFLKTNESLLPKEVSDIFNLASKETYGNALEKANATKAAIIQTFFNRQENLDILTPSQKSILADYLKLTKNSKEEKASEMYDSLFEPALASLKRVKKAEEIYKAKQGFGVSTDSDQAYKDKLTKMAEKKFFRGKNA